MEDIQKVATQLDIHIDFVVKKHDFEKNRAIIHIFFHYPLEKYLALDDVNTSVKDDDYIFHELKKSLRLIADYNITIISLLCDPNILFVTPPLEVVLNVLNNS